MARSRRAKTRKHLQRRPATREPYASVLVVCEGSKTEPNYFEALRAEYGLSSLNVAIVSGEGTDPMSVVRTSIQLFLEDGEYDQVFAVFDRNGHSNYEEAVQWTMQPPEYLQGRLFAITSWPCFEYWILLHFAERSRPYAGQSPCNQLVQDLRKFVPGYSKGRHDIFELTRTRLDQAKERAHRRLKDCKATDTSNPSTLVYGLVDRLEHLKDPASRGSFWEACEVELLPRKP